MSGHGRHTVAAVDPVSDTRWDELVRSHPDAGPYHLGGWAQVLRAAYGDRPSYLGLFDGDRLVGGLPLMRTRGLVTGVRLRSLPVVPPAGPLAPDDDGRRDLLEAACRAADDAGAKIWTLHARGDGYESLVPALQPRPKHPTWVLDLPDDVDEMRRGWKKSSNNLWRGIRKADRSGVTVREGRSEPDLRTFYELYLRTMRRRCVLPRPFRQLQEDRRLLGSDGHFRLFLAEHEGDVVAGGVYHALGRAVDLLYNGSDDDRLDVRPNHALYWHVIEWAAAEGHRELDFGHARVGSSLARFKAQWSAREVPEYRYDYVPGADRAAAPAAPSGGRALEGRGGSGPMERVWPHLPLPATRAAAALAYRFL